MGFLKVVLIVILVYYLFKILARLFAPKIFAYAARKTEERFKEQFENYQSFNQDNQTVGDITIDKKPTRKNKPSNQVGEYIDFEELE